MEWRMTDREMYLDASPTIVFKVVRDPEHVKKRWPDDARSPLHPWRRGEGRAGEFAPGGLRTSAPERNAPAVPRDGFSGDGLADGHAPGAVRRPCQRLGSLPAPNGLVRRRAGWQVA